MPSRTWYNSGQMFSAPLIIATILTNAASLSEAVYDGRSNLGFDIEGVVTLPNKRDSWHMAVEDESGGVLLRNHSPKCDTLFFKPGERLHLRGKTATTPIGTIYAKCTQAVVIAVQGAPVPRRAAIDEIHAGKFDDLLVEVSGRVREVFRDEVDPGWIYTILDCDGSRITVVFKSETGDISPFTRLTDATVSVQGFCTSTMHGFRRMIGRHISCSGPEAIRIVTPAPADPFAVPPIGDGTRLSPFDVRRMGRRRMNGRVVAVWSDRNFLLEDAAGKCHRIELIGNRPPAYDERVEVVGFPSTDLYSLHLGGGLWRPATNAAFATKQDARPTLTFDDFRDTTFGRITRFIKYNGRTARFKGSVVSIELGKKRYRNCTISHEDFTIIVNAGTAGDLPEDLAIGSMVEVTGTCVISTGTWHPSTSFPHVEGIPMVVLRRLGDMKIIASPPWWTPFRLMIVIGVLLVFLATILLWAITLKFVAERRGRQLFKSEIGKAEETLRVDERTRLAVELHDTLAQNLTGAAFQIEAAKDATEPKSEASSYLTCAEQILKSCRTELRRCIWDLKSNALEAPDLNTAILETIRPLVGNADVHIRFNVPRSRISDVTAHALLRIIRELVANAVHHGHATQIRIAGEMADALLRFSVIDNGSGFNPESCPGPSTGHFGLDGIRERIDKFGGTLKITSETGKGTKTTATIGPTGGRFSNATKSQPR